jgi:hypothetical protein
VNPCPPLHESWLAEWLAHGATSLEPAAQRELESCPHCSHELAQLLAVQSALASSTGDERAALAQAEREVGPDELRLVRAAFERAIAPGLEPAGKNEWSRMAPLCGALLIAAAVLLLFLVPMSGRRERGPAREVLLAPARISILAPALRVTEFERFSWSDATPTGDGYRVRIWPAEGAGELLHEELTKNLEIVLPIATTRAWPAHIAWSIEALDATGLAVARTSGRASRGGS